MEKTNEFLRSVKCVHPNEWAAAKKFRQKYFFGKVPTKDPYEWTFKHKEHCHFVLYKEDQMIGYAHAQLWPKFRSALRIIVIDEKYQGKGFGKQFLHWIEGWLKTEGYQSIHTQASAKAIDFYKNQGYSEMSFNDPDGHEEDPRDTSMGKKF